MTLAWARSHAGVPWEGQFVSYLIDGSNLGGVGGGRAGARDARAVVAWLLPWVRERSDRGRMLVVFDGAARPDVALHYGPMEVEFAAPRSADDAILARVRNSPKAWIVVTNDTALARACRELGAATHTASALARRVLARPGEPGQRRPPSRRPSARAAAADKPHPSGSEQAHWKAVFGGDADSDDEKE
ncbi:MAG TPA: NYN domain-containing protein [Thermoanaerobaculia bacterium]|nr:NYN domain-containing protein [Thermoanaerobaculia bacterium]